MESEPRPSSEVKSTQELTMQRETDGQRRLAMLFEWAGCSVPAEAVSLGHRN